MKAGIFGRTGYQTATAQFLSSMVGLAYQQFTDDWENGQIPEGSVPTGYTQVAAFRVPELSLDEAVERFLDLHPELLPLVTNEVTELADAEALALNARLSEVLRSPAELDRIAVGTSLQWFGFALAPTSDNANPANVIAIRGTRTGFEWAIDFTGVQVPIPLGWFSDGHFKLARVHLGFLILFAFLAPQVAAATAKFDAGAVTRVTGHSLGSALATLSSIFVKLTHLFRPVQMYNLASPRVGNSAFVSAYDFFVPESYRIVNLCDVVPMVPPTALTIEVKGHPVSIQYGDVGQEWSYLWQTGNVGGNHSWELNYDAALETDAITSEPRHYPNTGIPC